MLLEAGEQGRVRSELVFCLLVAQAEVALGQPKKARAALARALERTPPQDGLRVYLNEDEPLIALLRSLASERGHPAAARARLLLQVAVSGQVGMPAGAAVGESAIEPLTEQEERVLGLLAEGLSNLDIAQTLVISVNTVKTHLKSIYRKLGVNSRREARAAARQSRAE